MKKLESDVVVVGGGTAALPAAIAAAREGSSVILFEKAARTGGAANMASGLLAVESRLQYQRSITLSREEAFNIHMNWTHWRVDARLVSEFYNKSADTIDWLEELGVEFLDVITHNPGCNFTHHIVKGPNFDDPKGIGRSAGTMMKILTDRAEELGVRIFLKTPVKKILKDNGRISGVIAEEKGGEEIEVKAKVAIVATGGFSDDSEWIRKYTGYIPGKDYNKNSIPGMVGDGIRMAWEAGAAPTDMIMQISAGIFPMTRGLRTVSASLRQPSVLMVNLDGERFVNESNTNPSFIGNAVARQKDKVAFSIIDEDTKEYYVNKGWELPTGPIYDYYGNNKADTKAVNFDAEIEELVLKGSESVFVADSLEELATRTGINHDGLIEGLAEYNRACETGRDNIFHKQARYLRPLKRPGFYACKLGIAAYGSLGGIKINHKTEAIDIEHCVIPGLYAAGNDANSIYGDSYIFELPANTLGFAINSGRMAGENASRYIRGKEK